MGNESVRIAAIKSISILLDTLIFPQLFRIGVWIDDGVAASLLEFHALLLTHKETQCGIKVSPRLYDLNNVSLTRHALAGELEPSLISVSLEILAKANPARE